MEESKRLLAVGIAGGDLSATGIARLAAIDVAQAHEVLRQMRNAGLVSKDGTVTPEVAASLVADMAPDVAAELHAKAARYWMTAGPDHLLAALHQMRAAGTMLPRDELVDLADRAGQMSLSLHDYASAAELFSVAVELDGGEDPAVLGRRLCDWAIALDGLGRVSEARGHLVHAASLGEIADDGELVARAAIACSLPVDWYAGDDRAAALLARAEAMPLSDASRTQVQAARGLTEMRIPIAPDGEHQFAWITRPGVAQGLTETALEESKRFGADVQALAMLAWRATHRGPVYLEQRRVISKASLDQAQIIRHPSYQVESAVWLASDALESVDRALYDEALSVARWVADRDSNPRLIWRAHTLSCGAAHLDGDPEQAESWRMKAREVGATVGVPGWLAADFLLLAEWIVSHDDPEFLEQYVFEEDFPALLNPIGRALAAWVHAKVGHTDLARRMVQRSLVHIDTEGSYLFHVARCASVVEQIRDVELATRIVSLLEPWRGHVAVDGNAWFCDGPVERWLASMWMITGETDKASEALGQARQIAQLINDTRALSALTRLDASTKGARRSRSRSTSPRSEVLSPRQIEVLKLMAKGLTNREIGEKLAFSTSTVRVETMAIYRLLDVKSRTELGLHTTHR